MLQSIKNLSIRRKLKLAFGTIILFCTVAALLGALGIGTVFTHSRTLYTDYGQAQGLSTGFWPFSSKMNCSPVPCCSTGTPRASNNCSPP